MFFGPDFFKIQKNILIEPSSCFSIKKIKSVYHFLMQILYFLITLLIQINQIDVCPGVLILFPLYKKSTQVLLVDITLKCLTGLW